MLLGTRSVPAPPTLSTNPTLSNFSPCQPHPLHPHQPHPLHPTLSPPHPTLLTHPPHPLHPFYQPHPTLSLPQPSPPTPHPSHPRHPPHPLHSIPPHPTLSTPPLPSPTPPPHTPQPPLQNEDDVNVRVALVAVHLGLIEDAEALLTQAGEWSKLIELYAAAGEWGKAIAVAEGKERMRLKSTHFAHARHLEALGQIDAAMG